MAKDAPGFDDIVGRWVRPALPVWAAELAIFLVKLAWAALFGGLILLGLVVTKAFWTDATLIPRYDAMLLYALTLQGLFLYFRLESWEEARVILLFHITGTVMEIFKVNAGSWSYPDPGLVRVFDVPLFTGFMYASVGSFIARAIRLFDMQFAPYPPFWMTVVLAVAIYVNFFAHHFLPDARVALFIATAVLFYRTRVWFTVGSRRVWIPMVLGGLATAFCIWIAENIATATETWLYYGQSAGDMVPWSKMGSWYLLIFVSFTTVTLVFRDALRRAPKEPRPDGSPPQTTPQQTAS